MRALAAKDPKNPLAQYGLANELLKQGEYDEARRVLTGYLQMHDDEGAAYRLLARACERIGLEDDARDAYRQGIVAAERFGHASMADEYRERLDELGGA